MVVVTGGTGLVGGNLLWLLLQSDESVIAIRRDSSDLKPLRTIFSFYTSEPDKYLSRIVWKTANLLDEKSLTAVFGGARIVYHCAAVVSLTNSATSMLTTNVQGTQNVVKAALDASVDKLCFVSSIAACGKSITSNIIDENCTWEKSSNRSVYSQSKYYSEQEVWDGVKQGLNAVIVNPGVILGVSGADGGSSQLFSRVKKGLMFYTNGGSGYVDVQDVVKIMIQLANSEISGERFVLVGENCSNKEVLSWMADGFGKQRPFICIGRKLLLSIGAVSEFICNSLNISPTIDKSIARTATNREYYSSKKIIVQLSYTFRPIKECINEICAFTLLQKNK